MDSFATRHAHRRSPQVEKQARPPDSSDSEEQVPLLHGNRARSFGTLTPTASFISAAHPSAIPHTAQGAVAEQQATDPKVTHYSIFIIKHHKPVLFATYAIYMYTTRIMVANYPVSCTDGGSTPHNYSTCTDDSTQTQTTNWILRNSLKWPMCCT